ncbi:MAG: sigma 54-interacting transcriptional regulator [Syntrophomonas sp.]|uniref:sigma 54-interacting transcriptional regulator n=1 Tax=Syntrophomonas sp. TaxID=2053627 RepID=UPI0026318A30|nr:sigma 54-interacting transcriptional regulator [Syntrophomonas sp.]MDD2510258.1 sigma 54-interacting transcriptional regulator [Syntrophomonas sp.]MDD3879681.1 sigma 54-interacting transcriptional regulator [Syntrophomonas sp.]MDD4627099.1 sigma 54-interacting transcriptional regulator [Syntrophomonas sp.]
MLEINLEAINGALVESPYMALVTVNKDGYITLMNETFLDLLGLKKEQAIGKHVLEVLPHSELPDILKTGRIDKADIWPINGNDTVVTRFPLIKDGEIVGAMGQSFFLDMSGARILMQRLQETEEEFQAFSEALIENPYLVYVAVNKEGLITLINQTCLDALGMEKKEVIGRYILDIIPESRLPEVLQSGRIHEADIWSVNGRDTIVTRLPIIKNGKIIGAIAKSLFLDVSGAKMMLQKLQETQQEFQALFEALIESPYMVYVIVDKDGFITNMNKTYLDALALEREQVVGKHILEIIPESKLPEILSTGRIDKADIWPINGRDTIVTRLPIIKDDKIIGAIAKSLFLDMSGARILMHRLQETEKEFRAISEALIECPYMVYVIVDKDGIITSINQTYLDALGMEKSEVVGKHISKITPTSLLPEVLKTRQIDLADIYSINGQDTIVTRLPIIKDGEIIGAIARSLFMDISGAKILMNKLQETKKELNIYREELRQGYQAKWHFKDLIGQSPAFLKVKSVAEQVSHSVSTLLITGESGTGKELFAHAIHNSSDRSSYPFVMINCAALPDSLLESELFGYEEGAFTGARKGGKPGKFELAMGGTIFLDEIGDMPLNMQTRLLTVLQDRMVERIGGTRPIYIDVRVIAATNRDLEELVANDKFRQDLYYRLNVVRLDIPPLRERSDDIPLLAKNLIKKINKKLGTKINKISYKTIELMQNYGWPGNVRELENLLERALNLADMNRENSITIKHFPLMVENTYFRDEPNPSTLPDAIEQLEKQLIIQALEKTNGNKMQAAKVLGIYTSALYRKISKYGLDEL